MIVYLLSVGIVNMGNVSTPFTLRAEIDGFLVLPSYRRGNYA